MIESGKVKTNIPMTNDPNFFSETGYAMAMRRVHEIIVETGRPVTQADLILIKMLGHFERNMIRGDEFDS